MTNNQSQKDKSASKLSHELTTFADRLKPSEQYISEGKQLVQAVFGSFQKECRFSVDRPYYGGSVGKETSVIFPDFDCVIFLNNKQPPMKATVLEFVDHVKKEAKSLKIVPDSISNSPITCQMRFENGVELDLLPAINFSQLKQKQYEEVLAKIRENSKNFSDYSSSLAEIVIEFVKSQGGPTHQLIRLGKYWYKSLTLNDYLYGGSTMIEVLCVAAAYEVENSGSGFYITKALRKFFENVKSIDTLKIAFYRESEKGWKLIPEKELNQEKYRKYFSPEILKKRNFIIEPANPFNDLAQNLKKPETISRLKHYAEKMLERMNDLEKPENSTMKTLKTDGIVIHFDKFFEPMPIQLRGAYSHAAIPVYFLLHLDYQNYRTAHCQTDENKKEFFQKNWEARKAMKALRNNILFLIRAKAQKFFNGVAVMGSKNDVKEAINIVIKQNFGLQKFIKESTMNEDHKNYDATLYVPYRCSEKPYAVRLSLKWEH